MILLGLANAAFAVLAFTTDLVRLAPATAGALLVLGVATAAGGILVWRGSRAAVTVALTVFGLLLIAQLGEVLPGEEQSGPAPRRVVLGVLVAGVCGARLEGFGVDAQHRGSGPASPLPRRPSMAFHPHSVIVPERV